MEAFLLVILGAGIGITIRQFINHRWPQHKEPPPVTRYTK